MHSVDLARTQIDEPQDARRNFILEGESHLGSSRTFTVLYAHSKTHAEMTIMLLSLHK